MTEYNKNTKKYTYQKVTDSLVDSKTTPRPNTEIVVMIIMTKNHRR